jgi:hypothetical protein
MKYMTIAWWNSLQKRDRQPDTALADYRAYFEKIAAQLPPEFPKFFKSRQLHDAKFRGLAIDVAKKTAQLTLLADQSLVLIYEGLSDFKINYPPGQGLRAEEEFGDLGYDEVEVKGTAFEHRLLFSTGIELVFEFTQFSTIPHT